VYNGSGSENFISLISFGNAQEIEKATGQCNLKVPDADIHLNSEDGVLKPIYFRAPELFKNWGEHNEKIDEYSVGVIAYLLFISEA
jgi:hypothetical protein